MSTLYVDHLVTPIGTLAILADEAHTLRALGWRETHDRMDRQLAAYEKHGTTLVEKTNPGGLTAKLRAYFAGEVAVIDDLPAEPEGTEFQRTVWRTLREIPHGQTWSYAKLAKRIGNRKAVRAVGLANGANPIGIVVPCHRVIGVDGSLTGYGGGLERKRWLLQHERALML